MKKALLLLATLLPLVVAAQVKIPKGANRFIYWQIEYGEQNDTSEINVFRYDNTIFIHTPRPKGELIRGYCQTVTEVDYDADSITVTATYDDSVYFYRTALSRSDIEWEVKGKTHTCHINSNRLEFEMDEKAPVSVTPLPYYGLNKGVLRSFTRNGQKRLVLAKAERSACMPSRLLDDEFDRPSRRVSPRELDRIMKERLVVTTRIFDHEQLCWGKENAHLKGNHKLKPSSVLMPYDTVLHFAGGTVILKRMHLPWFPAHYQHFIEVHQQSNGDAYDRTGSIFVIPTYGYVLHNFFVLKIQFDEVKVSFPSFIPEAVIVIGIALKTDMEPVLVRTVPAFLQHILKGKKAASDMVEYPVYNDADTGIVKFFDQVPEILVRPEPCVNFSIISGIIAMGVRFEDR